MDKRFVLRSVELSRGNFIESPNQLSSDFPKSISQTSGYEIRHEIRHEIGHEIPDEFCRKSVTRIATIEKVVLNKNIQGISCNALKYFMQKISIYDGFLVPDTCGFQLQKKFLVSFKTKEKHLYELSIATNI